MPFNKIIAESMDLTDNYAFTGTVTGAGSSDFVKLNETVASNSSNVIFNNTLVTTTYKNYIVKGSDLAGSSNGAQLQTYISADNGGSYTGDAKRGFIYANLYSGASTGHAQQTFSNAGGFSLASGMSSSTNLGGSVEIFYNGITDSGNWKYIQFIMSHRHSGGEAYHWDGGCEVQQSGVVNTILIQCDTGNLYGTFTLYGVK